MSEPALLSAALLAATIGMACFALSIEAHRKQFFGERVLANAGRLALRVGGSLLLALAFIMCAAADPISMAILVWTMLLTMAAALVAAVITLHARTADKSR